MDNWPVKRILESERNDKEVEMFYSSKLDNEKNNRNSTILLPHRNFNNWVKKSLLSKYINQLKERYKVRNIDEFISVLDYGCGKGGDLFKYQELGISNYYGIDISKNQLKDAINRKLKNKIRFPATFINISGVSNDKDFFKNIKDDIYFDFISAQFCAHYFFENEISVRNFLNNVSKKLINDGFFVCTYPDSNVLVKKLRSDDSKLEGGYYVFENDYYSLISKSISFDQSNSPFGIKYGFFLDDGLIGNKYYDTKNEFILKEYIFEYLVIDKVFHTLAKEYDLEVVESKNFHLFYSENIQKEPYYSYFRNGFRNVPNNEEYLMKEEIWDISYLYKYTVFKKKSGLDVRNVSRNYNNTNYFKLY